MSTSDGGAYEIRGQSAFCQEKTHVLKGEGSESHTLFALVLARGGCFCLVGLSHDVLRARLAQLHHRIHLGPSLDFPQKGQRGASRSKDLGTIPPKKTTSSRVLETMSLGCGSKIGTKRKRGLKPAVPECFLFAPHPLEPSLVGQVNSHLPAVPGFCWHRRYQEPGPKRIGGGPLHRKQHATDCAEPLTALRRWIC